MIVPILFFCSGATALIYEVVWSKYLSLMFGSTVQAQTVVLAVFMGGLALGNRLFGGRADAARQPLALYGYMEVAIGLYAFFFNWIYRAGDTVFVAVGTGKLDYGWFLLLLKGVISVALLLGPTVLMGGTLPVLAAWLQRQSDDAGRWSARFYSINSLGAVAGSGLAGFLLVRSLGLVSTLQMTALMNVLVGFAAVGVARFQGDVEPAVSPTAAKGKPAAQTASPAGSTLRVGCMMVALTGAISMGLEILAARSLSLIFGASLQAFAIVLMSFILGIGIGSAVVASPRIRRLHGEATAAALLIIAACWIGVMVMGIEQWVEVYRHLRTGLARTEMGFRYHQLVAALISMVVLGVPAAIIGAVLPLWIRSMADRSTALGTQVGRLLTWNTLGAVAGTLLTGFVLMPNIGLRASFALLATLLCLTAVCVAWPRRLFRTGIAGLVVGAGLVLVGVYGGESWRHVLSSGVFRARETTVDGTLMDLRRKHVNILFYEDAADATVSVERGDGIKSKADTTLRVNGKPDASTHGDYATQVMMAHLPLMVRPDAKDVFVLGLGSGITAGALLGHPVEQVVVAENCKPVLRAAKFFEPFNRGVLTNSRVRFRYEDGRTVLKLSPQKYDAIISEPSNPWTAGVGSVFSKEFYDICSSRLKPGGIVCQWFHVYEMSDEIVAMVLRTFTRVFPYVEIWDVTEGDLLMLGAHEPWASSPEAFRKIWERPRPRRDLEAIGLKSPEAILSRQFASQRTAHAIAGEGVIQSDGFPTLEYEAPKAFYVGVTAKRIFLYDERTWQHELAPTTKGSVLRTLDKAQVHSAFAEFLSANTDLNQHLRWRFSNTSDAETQAARRNALPCIFWPVDATLHRLEIPTNASPDLARLIEAEHLIRTSSDKWQAGVDAVNEVLRNYRPDANRTSAPWEPSYFAMVAARASLSRGDRERARTLTLAGLRIDTSAQELLYLARILEREQPVQRPSVTAPY